MGRIGAVGHEAFQISEAFDRGDVRQVAGGFDRTWGEAGRAADEIGRAVRAGDDIGRAVRTAEEGGRAADEVGRWVRMGTEARPVFADTLTSAVSSVGAGIAGLSEAGIHSLARAFESLGLNLDNLAASVGGRAPLGAQASLPNPAESLGRSDLPGARRFQEVSQHLQNPELDVHRLMGEARESLSQMGSSISGPLGGLRDLLRELTQDTESLGEHLRAAKRRG